MKSRFLLLVALSASITMHPMNLSLFRPLKSFAGHVASVVSKCSSALSLAKEHKALAFGLAATAGLATLAYKLRRAAAKKRGNDLLKAVIERDLEKIRSLIDAGADVNIVNNADSCRTPLNAAASLGDKEVVDILLKAGAKIELSDDIGWTPLHHAVRKGAPEAVRVLLYAGARTDALDKWRLSPLHAASEHGKLEAVKALLDAGAATEARDIFKRTPLHYAITKGNPDVVRALVKAGAKKDALDCCGRSPLTLAQDAYSQEIMDILTQ